MPLSRAIIIACLTALKWLLWLVAVLLVLLMLRQHFLGPNGGVTMMQLFWLTAGSVIGGWTCGFMASRFE
ncbi:MAG: hypothetical protein K2P80_08960 [Beijerinckiaceae bacterium]|nr:hypothetical protein [Beijerinckiaceae bacterium]